MNTILESAFYFLWKCQVFKQNFFVKQIKYSHLTPSVEPDFEIVCSSFIIFNLIWILVNG